MIAKEIKQKALELGYAACGIIPSDVFDEYIQYVNERVSTFPESEKLYEPLYSMAKPPEAAKSIIVCIQKYTQYKIPDDMEGRIAKFYLFDGRLSYTHEHRAKEEFEAYLKTCGINVLTQRAPARWSAAKSGLGKFGRNNFLYSPEFGSYICIETWVVDKELDCDPITTDVHLSQCAENCNKCVKACPTNALTGGFSMDMAKCVTRITYYSGNIMDETIRRQMGLWMYGCDACQDACPVNKGKCGGAEEFPLLSRYEEIMKPENILAMNQETYENVVNARFWYAGKEALWVWKTHALRYMINSGKKEYHQLIKESCNHEDERIAEFAKWGCEELGI